MNSLLLALTLILSEADVDLNVQASLRPKAWTPGTRILLRDLLEPDDLAALDPALLDLDLGRSPSPGFGRLLTKRAILARIPAPGLTLGGPDEITVRTDTTHVSVEQILEGARKFLEQETKLRQANPDSLVEVSRRPFETRVPRGRASLELLPHFRGLGKRRGPVTVLTDVRVDGKLQMVIPTTFLLRTFANVPILAADLGRGLRLVPEQIKLVRTETTHRAPGQVVNHRPLLGQEAKRNLSAGTPLRARDFQPAVLIRRNDAVTVIFQRGAVRAETFGIARNHGSFGSSVRVESLSTKRILVGRVIGPGLIQVNP